MIPDYPEWSEHIRNGHYYWATSFGGTCWGVAVIREDDDWRRNKSRSDWWYIPAISVMVVPISEHPEQTGFLHRGAAWQFNAAVMEEHLLDINQGLLVAEQHRRNLPKILLKEIL